MPAICSQHKPIELPAQLRRNVADEGFVVHFTLNRSGDEKIICEILRRRDDGSRFPFNPANFSLLAKRSEKPLSFSVSKAAACTISKSAPQWPAKRLASASTPLNVGENVEATPTCW